MKELIKRIESEINKTPTGELRNLLCDANIAIQSLIQKEFIPTSSQYHVIEKHFNESDIQLCIVCGSPLKDKDKDNNCCDECWLSL